MEVTMKNPLITVIVPVYNVEKYIVRCIESIVNQTYKNLEILFVDDGTPDNSAKICQQYADKDSRITVLHKKNGGLSDARNFAMDRMKGDYVTFIDSDDYVSMYYVENLYNALSKGNADMSISYIKDVFEGDLPKYTEGSNTLENYELLSSEECLERMFYQDNVEISATGKLYKKFLFNDLRYPVGKLYEDIPVTPVTVQRSEKIAVIRNSDYFYFQRTDGIQNMKFNSKKMNAIENMGFVKSFIEENSPSNLFAFKCRYFSTVSNILFQINDDDHKKEKDLLWNELKKVRKDVLFNSKARKKARMGALLTYFGYPLMRFVYSKTQWRSKNN